MNDEDFDPYGQAKPWMLVGALAAIVIIGLMWGLS